MTSHKELNEIIAAQDKEIKHLLDRIEGLKKHIDKMSCCCAGCTKHNAQLDSDNGEKVGNEF